MSISSFSGGGVAVGGANDFTLLVGSSGNTTYVLDRVYSAGSYKITFINGDTSYDIYAIAENGTNAGYTNNGRLIATADFEEIAILGAAANERITFQYEGVATSPTSSGDISTAGAYVTSVGTASLPNVDDTTTVTGGNFATDVAVAFIGQDSNVLAAKNVVRSSSTSLIVTRPDTFTTAQSPYSLRVLNPGVSAPTGSNAHILSNSVTAGTNPVWTTTSPVYYSLGSVATAFTFLATDTEGSDIDYTVVSGTLPNGLSLNSETGAVSGTYSGAAADGDTNVVTIRATDAGGNFLDRAFTFTANAAPVWTTTAGALTNSNLNAAYSYQLVASTGTAGGTLTYSLLSGALPTGLSLSSTGLISGTNADTANTTDSFTIRVTDAVGLYTDRAFSITTPPLPTVSGGTLSSDSTYYYRTFTGSGTLTVANAALTADVMIIAGGGGHNQGGGGGAGGVVGASGQIPAGNTTITVGAGGAYSSSGGNSSVNGFTTAIGGGYGGGNGSSSAGTGGSGGGGAYNSGQPGAAGTPGQGYNGGNGGGDYKGGGGGGAGGNGGNGIAFDTGGAGGVGTTAYSAWGAATGTGENVGGTYYFAGGGGGRGTSRGGYGTGGTQNGTANTGGGATGYYGGALLSGQSGIVIVRYAKTAVGG